MAHFNATIPSSWTAEQTFDYLADFRSVAEWDPSMETAELVSGVAGQVGAVYRLTMTTLGKRTELIYTAVRVERPQVFVMRCETDALTSEDTVTVVAGQDGVRVTYDAQLTLKGVRKVVDPAAQVGLVLASERAKRSLAERLGA